MSRASWLIPAAVFAVAAAVYVVLGSMQHVPLVSLDEFLYGELSRSVADGDGLALYGTPQSWPARLFIYLIAPAWLGESLESGYATAKAIGAIAASTVVFPVWFLARRFTPAGPAFAVTALSVTGTWMVATTGLLTENLAYPLATASLAAAVLTLREPRGAWFWISLGFAVLATFTRAQMAVLFGILLCALLLHALLAEDRRAALKARRIELAVLGVIVLGAATVVLSGSETGLGRYSALAAFRPSAGEVLGTIGQQWLALVAACAFLPAAVLFALAARRDSWRDPDLGPLLCVTLTTIVLLIVQSGYFLAGLQNLSWSVERYVMIAVPLLLLLTFIALDRRLLSPRELAIAGAGVVLPLLAITEIRLALEERAQFGTAKPLNDLLGLGSGPAIALVAALVIGVGALIVARATPARAVLVGGALLLVVFVVQSQAIWSWHFDYTDKFRSQYPDDLSWVDANAGGPVTRLYLFASSPLFQVADFFNEDVDKVLVPAANPSETAQRGRVCFWNADARGVLVVSPGCPLQRRFWNDDPLAIMSFHGGRTIARDPMLGQVIAVPARPRLQSILRLPCQRQTLRGGLDGSSPTIPRSGPCGPTMAVDTWVDKPGFVELTFQGGVRSQTVANETRSWTLPPRVPTRVRVRVPAGQSSNGFNVDWTRSLGAPRLIGAAYISDGTRTPLL